MLQRHHRIGPGHDGVVMGGHDNGRTGGADRVEDPHDGGPGEPVLADGRLVGEDDRRLVNHSGGHGEPTLFPTGQLPRVGRCQMGQAQPVEQEVGPGGRGVRVEPDGERRGEHLVADRTSHDRAGRPLRYPGDGPGEVR